MFSSGGNDVSEGALWRRVWFGLIWGFFVAGILGFVLVSFTSPEVPILGRFGLAVYVGFWSGPFLGLSGAVGVHEVRKSQAARDAPAEPPRIPLTADATARGTAEAA